LLREAHRRLDLFELDPFAKVVENLLVPLSMPKEIR